MDLEVIHTTILLKAGCRNSENDQKEHFHIEGGCKDLQRHLRMELSLHYY
jgi:hypothetical protein